MKKKTDENTCNTESNILDIKQASYWLHMQANGSDMHSNEMNTLFPSSLFVKFH